MLHGKLECRFLFKMWPLVYQGFIAFTINMHKPKNAYLNKTNNKLILTYTLLLQ